MKKVSDACSRVIVLIVCCMSLVLELSAAEKSVWFAKLPEKKIGSLHVKVDGLSSAWKEASTQWMLPSVLVLGNDFSAEGPFEFGREGATIRDFLEALVKSYPEYAWKQDEATGVVWIYPKKMKYENVLADKVRFDHGGKSLRMQSDILAHLGQLNPSRISVKGWGGFFLNTFDYPVDLPKGEYTFRDILNRCLVANPTKGYFVQETSSKSMVITPANLINDNVEQLPPLGALDYWKSQCGGGVGKPSRKEIVEALEDKNPNKRMAAFIYLESIIQEVPLDKWIREVASPQEAIVLSLAAIEIGARIPGAIQSDAVERLQKEFSEDFVRNGDETMVLRVGLQLIRLSKEPASVVQLLAKKDFSKEALHSVEDYAHWVAKLTKSPEALQAIGFVMGSKNAFEKETIENGGFEWVP